MSLHFDLNIWGWIIVILNLLEDILTPFMFSQDGGKYTPARWLLSLLGTVLIFLALGVIR